MDINSATIDDLHAARDILVKTKAYYDDHGWLRGSFWYTSTEDQSCHGCLLGAALEVCGLKNKITTGAKYIGTAVKGNVSLDLAQQIIVETFKSKTNLGVPELPSSFRSLVPYINDSYFKSKADAVQAVDWAIEWIDGKIGAAIPVVKIPDIQKVDIGTKAKKSKPQKQTQAA